MLRSACLAAALATILTAAPALAVSDTKASATHSVKALDKELHGYLSQSGGVTSALVYDLTTRKTLYSVNPSTPRLPASVEKLYTTTTALFKFGANARFDTKVYGVGHLSSTGVWDGTLYLKGGGDPTFGSAAFDAAQYGVGATMQQLVKKLVAAGIKGVDGKILGDDSHFDKLRGTVATNGQANVEIEGELDGLSFDGGWTNVDQTKLQLHPTLSATKAFKSALSAAGIKVYKSTTVNTGVTPADAKQLGAVSSPPLSTLIELTNSPSDNFFAETLLKDIGASFGGRGSTAAGAAVVRTVIAHRLGLKPRLVDGSGLSYQDHTTVSQVVSLLRQMRTNPYFTDSLAIAGVRGTMEYEMLGTRAVNNCRGKTGTLQNVANLVGYCTATDGNKLVFAFLLNKLSNAVWGHELEDLMGETLAEYDAPKSSQSSSGGSGGSGGTTP
jgi:D-alanyl-D-alanine carboxypeptidase/D-alanyl-D-alanine-endopeptidase (penicillin-binding protein 4)